MHLLDQRPEGKVALGGIILVRRINVLSDLLSERLGVWGSDRMASAQLIIYICMRVFRRANKTRHKFVSGLTLIMGENRLNVHVQKLVQLIRVHRSHLSHRCQCAFSIVHTQAKDPSTLSNAILPSSVVAVMPPGPEVPSSCKSRNTTRSSFLHSSTDRKKTSARICLFLW